MNSNRKASTFNAKTALVVSKYWGMAGFKTWHIDAIRNGVDRLVKRYEGILKSRAKTSEPSNHKKGRMRITTAIMQRSQGPTPSQS